MSDAPETEVEKKPDAAPPESGASDSQEPAKKSSRPFIDFEKLPPDIRGVVEPAFRSLYGAVKNSERMYQALAAHNQELEKVVSEHLTATQQDVLAEKVSGIEAKIATALENGDYKSAAALTSEMTDVKTKALADAKPKARESEAGGLTPQEAAYAQRWASETDDDGQFKHPWAQPTHPKNAAFISTCEAVFQEPEFRHQGVERILAEASRRMGFGPKRQTTSPVLTSDPKPKPKPQAELTADQKAVARKMGIPEDRYLKQLQMMKRA